MDVRDASLTCPPGVEGIVVDAKVFSRKGTEKGRTRADHRSSRGDSFWRRIFPMRSVSSMMNA